MTYSLWVALGVVLAFVATRIQPPDRTDLTATQRQRLLFAAVIGALIGAFLCELPALHSRRMAWQSGNYIWAELVSVSCTGSVCAGGQNLATTTTSDPEFGRCKVMTATVALQHLLFTIAPNA